MPEPTHEERAGARVYKATSEPDLTDRKQYRGELARNSGEVQDATNNAIDLVEAGARVRPTGQHTEVPRTQYDKPDRPDAGLPDLVFSVVASVTVVAEVVGRARERRRKRREHDGSD